MIAILWEMAWKSALLLAAAFAAEGLMRRAPASLRHAVWGGAFCGLLLLPFFAPLLPDVESPLLAPVSEMSDASARTILSLDVTAASKTRLPWLALIWMAGVIALLARLTWRYAAAGSVARRSAPWPEEGPDVRLSRATAMPYAFGLAEPVVVLPEEAPGWPEDRLRLVLAHERTHIARQDTRISFVAQIVCALYWFNPLVWLAFARLRAESERACDDAVLLTGEEAPVYASHLVEIARSVQSNRPVPEGGIPMARMSQLEQRLTALLDPALTRAALGRGALTMTGALIMAALIPLAALRAPAQQRSANPSLEGKVVNEAGEPVRAARVKARSLDSADVTEVAMTGHDGTFALGPLGEGSWNITVTKEGYSTVLMQSVKIGLEPVRLEVKLLPAGLPVDRAAVVPRRIPPREPALSPTAPPKRIHLEPQAVNTGLIQRSAPVYPAGCKAEGVEGTVVLRTVISREGLPQAVDPVNKLVDQRLVEAARTAVKQWRWKPTLLNGVPVEVMVDIEINFRLDP